jgi:hypothetical protein
MNIMDHQADVIAWRNILTLTEKLRDSALPKSAPSPAQFQDATVRESNRAEQLVGSFVGDKHALQMSVANDLTVKACHKPFHDLFAASC